jgi:hypothetical protein
VPAAAAPESGAARAPERKATPAIAPAALRGALHDRRGLATAFLLSEILGPPLSERRER